MRLFFCLFLGLCFASAASARPLALVGVRIVDVERGTVGAATTIVLDGDVIAAIGGEVPADAEVLDHRGRFVIPGLIDAHVHLFNTASKRPPNDWAFPLFLEHGVTSVREMAADLESMAIVEQWRRARDRPIPRILAVGIPLRATDPEWQSRIDAIAKSGADFVKIFDGTPAERLPDLVAYATARGLEVAGHSPPRNGERLATNEHLSHIDATLAHSTRAEVPTLVLFRPKTTTRDARWPSLRADEQARWTRILDSDEWPTRAAQEAEWADALRRIAFVRRAGVTVVAGTDAPMPLVYPGSSLHEELAALVAAGLSNAGALRAATVDAARVLGAHDLGVVAVGKRADLVVLRANPLDKIGHTRTIDTVVLRGRLVRRPP